MRVGNMHVKIKHKNGYEEEKILKPKEIREIIKNMAEHTPTSNKRSPKVIFDFLPNSQLSNPKINPQSWELFQCDEVIFDCQDGNIIWKLPFVEKNLPMPKQCESKLEKINLQESELQTQVDVIEAFQNFVRPCIEDNVDQLYEEILKANPDIQSSRKADIDKHIAKLNRIEEAFQKQFFEIETELKKIPDEVQLSQAIQTYQGKKIAELEENLEGLEVSLEDKKHALQERERDIININKQIDQAEQEKGSQEIQFQEREEEILQQLRRENKEIKTLEKNGSHFFLFLKKKKKKIYERELQSIQNRQNKAIQELDREQIFLVERLHHIHQEIDKLKKAIYEEEIQLQSLNEVLEAHKKLEMRRMLAKHKEEETQKKELLKREETKHFFFKLINFMRKTH